MSLRRNLVLSFLVGCFLLIGSASDTHSSLEPNAYCGPACSGADRCNAIEEVFESQTHLRGIQARIEIADPQLRHPNLGSNWSVMRVLTWNFCPNNPQQPCFLEVGWVKNACFTTPGCSRYGSWKLPIRHAVFRQNPNGYVWLDISNTWPGNTNEYRVEKDDASVGWEAYVDNNLVARYWTGFSAPYSGWGGGEVVNPPYNAMGVSGILNAKYMGTDRVWRPVNDQYITESNSTIFHAVKLGPNDWQVYGCNQ